MPSEDRSPSQSPRPDTQAAAACHQQGESLCAAGRLEEAVVSYQQALQLHPGTPRFHHSLGLALGRLSRWPEAVEAYRRALALQPDYSAAHNNLGTVLLEQQQHADAAASFREAIRLQPTCAEAHNNLGIALSRQGQHQDALASFHTALKLRPDSPGPYLGLGVALRELGRVEEALAPLQQVVRLQPTNASLYNELGITQAALNRLDAAIALFDRALELQPDYPLARKNRGVARLTQGDFARGWVDYEERLRDAKQPARSFTQPRWDGSPLAGRTLLVYHEQGLGDTLQFVRYLPLIERQGGRVVFECPRVLRALLAGCAGIDELVAAGAELPAFDVQVPLLSLPYLVGTTLASLPAAVPYLQADAGRVQLCAQVLGRLRGFKVAIAWQGNARFKGDRFRSMPLQHFGRLAKLPGVRLLSVQHGPGSEQIGGVAFAVLDLGPELDQAGAFTDTAAILRNVDLTITSDSAVAHLAGALGVPVWVALPFAADWRWLLQRADCPWYPTMRLFRQRKHGNWEEVFQRLAAELEKVVRSTGFSRNGAGDDAESRLKPVLRTEEGEAVRSTGFSRNGAGDDAESRLKPVLRTELRTEDRLKPGLQPEEVAAWLQRLGNALARVRQRDEAVDCFQEALRLDPKAADADAGLGLASLGAGRPAEAINHFQRCLARTPQRADIQCHLGVAFFRLHQYDGAIAAYHQALRLQPEYADAHNNLGNVLRLTGQLDAAVASLAEASRLRPELPEAHYLMGLTLAQQSKHPEAEAALRRAIQLRPTYAGAHLQLGTTLALLNRHDEAITALTTAAELDPHHAEVPYRLGNSLRQAGKLEEAVAAYRASLRLQPQPAEPWLNLGVTLANLGRFEEAEAAYRSGLRHRPGHVDLLNNLGLALKNQDRLDEALACLDEALRLAPEHVEAHRNRGVVWLLQGDLERGLPELEWRLRRSDRPRPRFTQPQWDGGALAGRTILLHPEQGLGDTIQFVRYAALLKAQGATVLLLCSPKLVPLLSRCRGIDRLVTAEEPPPQFDVHASLLSLPALLRTTLATVPAEVPYLTAAPDLVTRWGGLLQRLNGFKVGIAWQGNPHYTDDRGRSLPLRCFEPLARLPGVQLVSLQKGPGVEQLASVDFPLPSFDHQVDETAGAFMDTAAILRHLDLVITSDTALAHLAGALAVPVWVVLPQVPDWRWLRERADSPWYPTMRLFRQRQRGDWEDVLARVAAALVREAGARGR